MEGRTESYLQTVIRVKVLEHIALNSAVVVVAWRSSETDPDAPNGQTIVAFDVGAGFEVRERGPELHATFGPPSVYSAEAKDHHRKGQAMQRHVVVIPRDDGGVEIYPMKRWLRQHPDQMPPNLGPDPSVLTSHQLRSGLRRIGWTIEETSTEVRLLAPGTDGKVELEDVLGEVTETDGDDESPYFSLEYQLRDFLADNLGSVNIDGRRLSLYKDSNGEGVEYPTSVGPIDILAIDNHGAFFIFELKRANSPDRAVGQVARYMGWVKQTIGREREVYGVIVAKTISEKLKFARTVVPNVYLFEYQVSFSLKPAHDVSPS